MTRVAVIGPGLAGTSVAVAADEAGYDVDFVAGRGEAALARFVELIPSVRVLPATEAVRRADLVVIGVPDAAVGEVARDLAIPDAVPHGARVIHLSGCLGLAPLEPLHLAGARVAACHPAQTLADPRRGREALTSCAWAVTATAADRNWARRFVRDLEGQPFDIADADRTAYHAAMTLAGNAVSAVVTLARDLLLAVGVREAESFLVPLAQEAVAGAAQRGAAALTGPVRRGDAGTVAAHVDELAVVLPEALEVYRALGRLTLSHAVRAGLDDASADAVRAVLEDPSP